MSSTSPSPSACSASESENDIFSSSLVPPRQPKSAGTTSLSLDGLLSPPLLLYEDLSSGCGGQLWPAGMHLASYLLTHYRESLRGKQVLELGAGGGLVGLAVASGCEIGGEAGRLVMTDQEPMLALMEKNIALNEHQLRWKVEAKIYDWGSSSPPAFATATGQPDVVLAADCVYFEPAFPLLLKTMEDVLGPETVCWFCLKKRRKADMRFVRDMMKRFGCEEVEWEGKGPGVRGGIRLWRVTRKLKRPVKENENLKMAFD